jgi:hypothetical protein
MWYHTRMPNPKDEKITCPRCRSDEGEEDHTCPYKSDLDGDYHSMCNCCEQCQEGCAWEL